MYDNLSPPGNDLRILGVDISKDALQLAFHNLKRAQKDKAWNLQDKAHISFLSADVLRDPFADQPQGPLPLKVALNRMKLPQFWDIVISNPPYISPKEYWKTTTRSVRGFEPKLALVPPQDAGDADLPQGDAFYQPLLNIARDVEAKIILLEIADLDQALRVASQARKMRIFDGIEIWRDQPDGTELGPETSTATSPDASAFPTVGQGHARTVFCYRGLGTEWLRKVSVHPPSAIDDSDSTILVHRPYGGLKLLPDIHSPSKKSPSIAQGNSK
jgi:hypothetical protein